MQNISDDELDKVFREAAGKQSFDFDPSAWESMRHRLDQGHGAQDSFLNSRMMSTVLAVCILLSLWYQTQRSGTGQELTATVATPTLQPSVGAADAGNLAPSDYQQKDSIVADNKRDFSSGSNDDATTSQQPVRRRVTATVNPLHDVERQGIQEPSYDSRHRARTDNSERRSTENLRTVEPSSASTQEQPAETSVVENYEPQRQRRIAVTPSEVSPDSVKQQPSPQSDSVMVTVRDSTVERPERDAFQRAWFVRASVAPDLTTVGIDKPTKIGSNFGLTLEYQFARHWSVSTGAILSRKIYEGTDVEYAFGASTVKADEMEGNCRVLDIPLNVYYYAHTHRRISFFAGIGVTSYLMLTEDYAYTVTNSYGTRVYKQDLQGENQDWFKQLNLSVGIQSRLSRRLWWQVEPFFKAPLAGVGEGKVSLATSGAFLSVRYQITKD